MLTRFGTNFNAIARYRMGTMLIWVGVLVWVPFITLMMLGQKLSLFWFLPFHLIGVIGGASLRRAARRALHLPQQAQNWLRIGGHGLIILGVLAWAPYFYAKLWLNLPVEAAQYLPFHLSGVISGIALLIIASRKKENGE